MVAVAEEPGTHCADQPPSEASKTVSSLGFSYPVGNPFMVLLPASTIRAPERRSNCLPGLGRPRRRTMGKLATIRASPVGAEDQGRVVCLC